ncbi:hypothetical protein OF83DRAFT_1284982 [Amylostereum chailletii]|nr:hypothetical protein OF83DRAFT_1284982 [Amylostereum chailletii]
MLSWFQRTSSHNGPREPSSNLVEDQPLDKRSAKNSDNGLLLPRLPSSPVVPILTRTPSPIPVATPPEPEPQRRAITAALSTPHDAVLAELRGHHPAYDVSAHIDTSASARGLGGRSNDTLPTASSVGNLQDKIFDPFTGASMGVATARHNRDELWTHLARVRALQADIAGMHVTMEGIGLGETGMRSRGARARTRSGNVGERLDFDGSDSAYGKEGAEKIDEEEERRRIEREREFDMAEKRFDRRKEEIDKIMGKISDLSHALATFHALDTPAVELASRANTFSTLSTPITASPMPRSANSTGLNHFGPSRQDTAHDDIFSESPASGLFSLPSIDDASQDRRLPSSGLSGLT